jgi:hypothetical protein
MWYTIAPGVMLAYAKARKYPRKPQLGIELGIEKNPIVSIVVLWQPCPINS